MVRLSTKAIASEAATVVNSTANTPSQTKPTH